MPAGPDWPNRRWRGLSEARERPRLARQAASSAGFGRAVAARLMADLAADRDVRPGPGHALRQRRTMAARSPGPTSSRRDDLTAAAAQHARRPRARGRPSWCPPRASTPGTAHPGSRQPQREPRPSCPCAARQPPASPAEPAALRPPGIPVAAISGVTGRSGSSGRRRSRRDRPGHAAGNQAGACCPAAHRTFIQARRRLHCCRGTKACRLGGSGVGQQPHRHRRTGQTLPVRHYLTHVPDDRR